MKPRILVVMFQVADRANGGVNSLMEVILRLHQFQPVVLTQVETPVNERLRAAGVEVILGPEGKTGSGILPKLNFSLWLLSWVKKQEITLCHVNDMRAYLHVFPALLLARIPIVFNLRDVFAPNRSYGLHWRSLRFSQAIVGLSQEMKNAFQTRLPLPEKKLSGEFIHFIYSIVDFERFYRPSPKKKSNLRSELGMESDTIYLLYVAKVDEKKQQLKFIKQLLPELSPKCEVLFLGDYRPERDAYDAACAQALSTLETGRRYRMVGFVDQVERYFHAADIVVVPTQREGMARCMIEGISSALPIVSFDVCSAREILIGHNCGLVYEQGDYAGFLSGIQQLANDPELREQMGANGYSASRELFAADVAVKKYEQLYVKIGEA